MKIKKIILWTTECVLLFQTSMAQSADWAYDPETDTLAGTSDGFGAGTTPDYTVINGLGEAKASFSDVPDPLSSGSLIRTSLFPWATREGLALFSSNGHKLIQSANKTWSKEPWSPTDFDPTCTPETCDRVDAVGDDGANQLLLFTNSVGDPHRLMFVDHETGEGRPWDQKLWDFLVKKNFQIEYFDEQSVITKSTSSPGGSADDLSDTYELLEVNRPLRTLSVPLKQDDRLSEHEIEISRQNHLVTALVDFPSINIPADSKRVQLLFYWDLSKDEKNGTLFWSSPVRFDSHTLTDPEHFYGFANGKLYKKPWTGGPDEAPEATQLCSLLSRGRFAQSKSETYLSCDGKIFALRRAQPMLLTDLQQESIEEIEVHSGAQAGDQLVVNSTSRSYWIAPATGRLMEIPFLPSGSFGNSSGQPSERSESKTSFWHEGLLECQATEPLGNKKSLLFLRRSAKQKQEILCKNENQLQIVTRPFATVRSVFQSNGLLFLLSEKDGNWELWKYDQNLGWNKSMDLKGSRLPTAPQAWAFAQDQESTWSLLANMGWRGLAVLRPNDPSNPVSLTPVSSLQVRIYSLSQSAVVDHKGNVYGPCASFVKKGKGICLVTLSNKIIPMNPREADASNFDKIFQAAGEIWIFRPAGEPLLVRSGRTLPIGSLYGQLILDAGETYERVANILGAGLLVSVGSVTEGSQISRTFLITSGKISAERRSSQTIPDVSSPQVATTVETFEKISDHYYLKINRPGENKTFTLEQLLDGRSNAYPHFVNDAQRAGSDLWMVADAAVWRCPQWQRAQFVPQEIFAPILMGCKEEFRRSGINQALVGSGEQEILYAAGGSLYVYDRANGAERRITSLGDRQLFSGYEKQKEGNTIWAVWPQKNGIGVWSRGAFLAIPSDESFQLRGAILLESKELFLCTDKGLFLMRLGEPDQEMSLKIPGQCSGLAQAMGGTVAQIDGAGKLQYAPQNNWRFQELDLPQVCLTANCDQAVIGAEGTAGSAGFGKQGNTAPGLLMAIGKRIFLRTDPSGEWFDDSPRLGNSLLLSSPVVQIKDGVITTRESSAFMRTSGVPGYVLIRQKL